MDMHFASQMFVFTAGDRKKPISASMQKYNLFRSNILSLSFSLTQLRSPGKQCVRNGATNSESLGFWRTGKQVGTYDPSEKSWEKLGKDFCVLCMERMRGGMGWGHDWSPCSLYRLLFVLSILVARLYPLQVWKRRPFNLRLWFQLWLPVLPCNWSSLFFLFLFFPLPVPHPFSYRTLSFALC